MSPKSRMLNYLIDQTVAVIEGLEAVIAVVRDDQESVDKVRDLQRKLSGNLREYIRSLAADED